MIAVLRVAAARGHGKRKGSASAKMPEDEVLGSAGLSLARAVARYPLPLLVSVSHHTGVARSLLEILFGLIRANPAAMHYFQMQPTDHMFPTYRHSKPHRYTGHWIHL